MNLFSWVLVIVIGIWLAIAVRYMIKHRGQGCGGCNGNCSGDCQHCKRGH